MKMRSINIKRTYFRQLFYLSAVLIIFSFSDQLDYTSLKHVDQSELIVTEGEKPEKVNSIFQFEKQPQKLLIESKLKIETCFIQVQNIKLSVKAKAMNKTFYSIKMVLISRWASSIQQNSNYLA